MLPNILSFPVWWNWHSLLKVSIWNILAEFLWFLDNEIDNASFLFFENRCFRNVKEHIQQFFTKDWEFSKLSKIAFLVIFNNWYFMLFEEVKCSVWRNASIWTVGFDDRIEVNSYIGVFNQMLEIRVTAVLSDHCFSS